MSALRITKVTMRQILALTNEVEASVKLIQVGLGELQRISGANNFYHLPFLLLSSGFERLLKCIICLRRLEDSGAFPTTEEIKTHDLLHLLDKVLHECISLEHVSRRPATKADYEYMVGDQDLRRLLNVLSEFGKFSRYHNLDVITLNHKPSVDAQRLWEKYETELVSKYDDLTSLQTHLGKLDELYTRINSLIVAKLERLARSLCRQFTLGELGTEARRQSGVIGPFLNLTDEHLGLVDYRTR